VQLLLNYIAKAYGTGITTAQSIFNLPGRILHQPSLAGCWTKAREQ